MLFRSFTDCMLQNGASKVYAIDVGYGQLAWDLRNNEKVVNLERTNIHYVTKAQVPDVLDFVSADVSFISLRLVLPIAFTLLKEKGHMICLVKPQFEAGREKVGKKGVVREPEIHREVIDKIIDFADCIGFLVKGLDFSPIKGPEGNIEYLLYLQKKDCIPEETEHMTEAEAQRELERVISGKCGLSQEQEMKGLTAGIVEIGRAHV